MKLSYTTANGRIRFEAEVQTGKLAFQMIAAIQELFEEAKCGMCECTVLRCNYREHEGNGYYNLVCTKCDAQLDFGQKKDGKGMWAKRKDKDGHPLGKNGWYKWQGASSWCATTSSDNGPQRARQEQPSLDHGATDGGASYDDPPF